MIDTVPYSLKTESVDAAASQWSFWSHIVGESLRSSSGAGTVSRTSLEKRASVLEGALRQNPSSIRLRIAQLHIASQMHEHDAVDSLWRGAIKK